MPFSSFSAAWVSPYWACDPWKHHSDCDHQLGSGFYRRGTGRGVFFSWIPPVHANPGYWVLAHRHSAFGALWASPRREPGGVQSGLGIGRLFRAAFLSIPEAYGQSLAAGGLSLRMGLGTDVLLRRP